MTTGDILACSGSCAVRAGFPAAVLSRSDMWQLSADYSFLGIAPIHVHRRMQSQNECCTDADIVLHTPQ